MRLLFQLFKRIWFFFSRVISVTEKKVKSRPNSSRDFRLEFVNSFGFWKLFWDAWILNTRHDTKRVSILTRVHDSHWTHRTEYSSYLRGAMPGALIQDPRSNELIPCCVEMFEEFQGSLSLDPDEAMGNACLSDSCTPDRESSLKYIYIYVHEYTWISAWAEIYIYIYI